MKITLESTTKLVQLETQSGATIEARLWEGFTESGIPVHCFVTRIMVADDLDQSQFIKELESHRKPTVKDRAYDLRLLI